MTKINYNKSSDGDAIRMAMAGRGFFDRQMGSDRHKAYAEYLAKLLGEELDPISTTSGLNRIIHTYKQRLDAKGIPYT